MTWRSKFETLAKATALRLGRQMARQNVSGWKRGVLTHMPWLEDGRSWNGRRTGSSSSSATTGIGTTHSAGRLRHSTHWRLRWRMLRRRRWIPATEFQFKSIFNYLFAREREQLWNEYLTCGVVNLRMKFDGRTIRRSAVREDGGVRYCDGCCGRPTNCRTSTNEKRGDLDLSEPKGLRRRENEVSDWLVVVALALVLDGL